MNRTLTIAGAAALLMTLAGTGCTDPTVAPKSTVTSANIFNDPNSYRAFLAKIFGGVVVTGPRAPPRSPHIFPAGAGGGGKRPPSLSSARLLGGTADVSSGQSCSRVVRPAWSAQ